MAAEKHRKHLLPFVIMLALVVAVLGITTSGCGDSVSGESPGHGSGEEITLQLTHRVGDSWAYELTTVLNGSVEGAGALSEIAETTTSRVTSLVTAVNDEGVATVEVTHEVLGMTSNGVSVDVTGQEPQKVTVTVDRTGRTLSVTGVGDGEAALDHMFTGAPFNFNDLSGHMSEVIIFPADGTARIGEEWESTAKVPLSGLDQEITATSKSKLTAVSTENGRETATIEFVSSAPMDLRLDLGAMLAALMEGFGGGQAPAEDITFVMTLKGKMEFPGVTQVDRATGRPISLSSDGAMNLEMEIAEAPADMVPADQRGPFKMNLTVTLDMVEVRPQASPGSSGEGIQRALANLTGERHDGTTVVSKY